MPKININISVLNNLYLVKMEIIYADNIVNNTSTNAILNILKE
jgi:hypothetical protein